MKKSEIRNAFGSAPLSFQSQVNQMIDDLEDKPMKKKLRLTTILIAALVAALAGTAAVAAFSSHIQELFKNPEEGLANDAALSGIQELHESYEGAAVRCTVQEALYDGEGSTYALSWALDNLTGEDDLYIICDKTLFDGKSGDWRNTEYVSWFFLPQGTTVANLLGELPDANANHCELGLTVLRPTGPYDQEGDGYITVDGRYLTDENILYSDALVAQGNFEIADRFTLNFDLDMEKLGSTVKHLVGENDYKYDGYELNVTSGEITATSAHIVVEYISDTEIIDGGKGIGPNYDIDFIIPGGDIWWTGNSGGTLGDPERLPDGRWRSVYDFEAVQLFTQPSELQLVFSTYPAADGEVDLANPVLHDEVDILLRFE